MIHITIHACDPIPLPFMITNPEATPISLIISIYASDKYICLPPDANKEPERVSYIYWSSLINYFDYDST